MQLGSTALLAFGALLVLDGPQRVPRDGLDVVTSLDENMLEICHSKQSAPNSE